MSQISRLAEIVLLLLKGKYDSTAFHLAFKNSCIFSVFNTYLFMAVLGLHCCTWLSLTVKSSGYSSLQCAGFSLQWFLLLWTMGPRLHRLSSCGHRLGCSMWDLPGPRNETARGFSNHWITREVCTFFPCKLRSMAGKAEGRYKNIHIFVRKALDYMPITKLLPTKDIYKYN